jgi:hypothetical protein
MRYRTCREAYQDGVTSRLSYPLNSGLYKLVESKDRIERVGKEVIRISEVVTKKRDPSCLMHCTAEDKAFWLRDVPLNVAYRMGYEIIPGLRALEAEGVGHIHAESAAFAVESVMDHHLDYWDELRNSYNTKISCEYERMSNGHSNALWVVDDALDLIDLGVSQLPVNFQAGYEKWASTHKVL